MPVTLVVRRKGEPDLPPVAFDGPRVVIGRGTSCDLRVPDASVSGRHASIRASGASWVVVDEGSTNGTRLNGEKLATQAPRKLETGDVLMLGRVEIAVRLGAAAVSNANATRELALALVARSLGDERATALSISVPEGPVAGARIELSKDGPVTSGRDPRCTLRLTDRGIPPIAVEVAIESGRARVTRRDPRVEPKLAERPLDVGVATPWGDGVVLTIASSRLVLDDPVARALDQSAHGEDEKWVPPPPEPAPEPAPEPPPEPAPPPAPEAAAPPEPPPPPPRPSYDRRKSWRGATLAFEVVALILGLLVLGGSAAGLWWLLRR